MARRARVRECAYCGDVTDATRDHVVPKALFTPPFPTNLITVPCCAACNNAKSLDDEYLRDLLTCDIVAQGSAAAREVFHEGVLGSVAHGRCFVAREAVRRGRVDPVHTRAGLYLGTYHTIPLDEDRVTKLFARMARGLFYSARGQRIPQDYRAEVRRYFPWEFAELQQAISRLHPQSRRVGDVFECSFYSAQEDSCTTWWFLCFYERLLFSVWLVSPELV